MIPVLCIISGDPADGHPWLLNRIGRHCHAEFIALMTHSISGRLFERRLH